MMSSISSVSIILFEKNRNDRDLTFFLSRCSSEGLSRMAVVIKLSGAGSTSDGRREGLVSTARRLAHLSQTARLRYGFRTVDTWNMTTARFRDFLPGRCACHFHQVSFTTCFFFFYSSCRVFRSRLFLSIFLFDTRSLFFFF